MLTPNQQPAQPSQSDQDTANRKKQSGSGFTNISKMLGANQGAGAAMGQKIGTSLATQAGDVREGIKAGQQQFGTQMQAGQTAAQGAIGQGQQLQRGATEDQATYEARLANADQSQLASQGKALQGAAYQGPQGLATSGQLASKAATAGALGRLGATGAGQSQLLASQVAQRGNYGQGQSALDQMLLGKQGQQAIQTGRSSTSGLEGQVQGATQAAAAQAGAAGQNIEANKVAALHALQNQLSGTGEAGTQKGFTQQAKEQGQAFNTQATRLSALLRGDIDPDTGKPIVPTQDDIALINNMESYGLSPDQMMYSGGTSSDVLGRLTGNANLNQSAGRYMGSQGAAAQNLASFLQQDPTKIDTTSFTTKAFSPTTNQEVLASNAQEQSKDEAIRSNAKLMGDQQASYNNYLQAAIAAGGDRYGEMQNAIAQATKIRNAYGLDPANKSVAQWQAEQAAHTGQQKSLKQLALERYGAYTPPKQDIPAQPVIQQPLAEEEEE